VDAEIERLKGEGATILTGRWTDLTLPGNLPGHRRCTATPLPASPDPV
jgi:hypothetical protein